MSRVFYTYGKFCASRPWEVMISFLTVSICLFSLSGLQPTANENAAKQHETICPKDTVNCNSEVRLIIATCASCDSNEFTYVNRQFCQTIYFTSNDLPH